MKFIITLLLLIHFTLAQDCKSNQYKNATGSCQNCTANCESCLDKYSCQKCADRYELRHISDKVYGCAPCSDANCKRCSVGVCAECDKHYVLIDGGKCEFVPDNSKTVILILGIIVAAVVIIIAVDILIGFIRNKSKNTVS